MGWIPEKTIRAESHLLVGWVDPEGPDSESIQVQLEEERLRSTTQTHNEHLYRLAIRVLLGGSALFLVWVQLRLGGDNISGAVDDIGQLLAAVCASAACFMAWRGTDPGAMRDGWGLMSVSAGCWGAGQVIWCYYDLLKGVTVPFPSMADVGYLTAVPFATGCLLLFGSVRARYNADYRRRFVRSFWVVSVILAAFLVVVILHAGNADPTSPLARVFGAAYPMSDLLLASLVVKAYKSSPAHGSAALMLAGVLAFAIADTAFALETAANSYGIGNGFDTGWVLGYSLMALGALRHLAQPARYAGTRHGFGAFVPNLFARMGHTGVSHMINGVGALLILVDAGVSIYDLDLFFRALL